MLVGGTGIGNTSPPFIIAELSGNHGGSLDQALLLVEAAAAAGASAVKIQTFTADTMTLDVERPEFVIQNPESLWFGRKLYDLYQEAHTPWDWHPAILERAHELGLVCFSSPFDDSAVDFLDALGVPAFKIASFECVDLPLIRRASATGKPLIISTGMATLDEIDEAVGAARSAGCDDLVLLKCTSTYPASPDDSNLNAIAVLRDRYGCEVGLSDHTLGIGVSLAAIALGATVIEKHVTLDRSDGSVDAAFSLEPDELATLVEEANRAWRSLGTAHIGPTEAEKSAVTRRRSLYVGENIRAGEQLTEKNVVRIRPGLGLAPRHYDEVLGRTAAVDIARGTPLSWDLVADLDGDAT